MPNLDFTHTKRAFLRALFPPACAFCGRLFVNENDAAYHALQNALCLCRTCLAKLSLRVSCEQVFSCADDMSDNFWVVCPLLYDGPVCGALRKLKFHGTTQSVRPLSFLMYSAWQQTTFDIDLIIPVPLSDERLRKRGYNQAALLAHALADLSGKICLEKPLVRKRHTRPQSELQNRDARFSNTRDAFHVLGTWDLHGARVLLVDDILTTGSTLYCARQALLDAGVRSVVGICAASSRGKVILCTKS